MHRITENQHSRLDITALAITDSERIRQELLEVIHQNYLLEEDGINQYLLQSSHDIVNKNFEKRDLEFTRDTIQHASVGTLIEFIPVLFRRKIQMYRALDPSYVDAKLLINNLHEAWAAFNARFTHEDMLVSV